MTEKTQPEDLYDEDNTDTDQAEPGSMTTNPPPPNPNPLTPNNPYPRPETGPNWPLLRATRDLIANLPRRKYDNEVNGEPGWVQSDWRCGTGMCFAGWAAALTGATFPYAPDDEGDVIRTAGSMRGYSARAAEVVVDTDGDVWDIPSYARHMLGLHDSTVIFQGDNGLRDIDDILDEMKAAEDDIT